MINRPSIKLNPRTNEHTVSITVELDFLTTTTIVSDDLSIHLAIRKALSYHYDEVKRREISRYCGDK